MDEDEGEGEGEGGRRGGGGRDKDQAGEWVSEQWAGKRERKTPGTNQALWDRVGAHALTQEDEGGKHARPTQRSGKTREKKSARGRRSSLFSRLFFFSPSLAHTSSLSPSSPRLPPPSPSFLSPVLAPSSIPSHPIPSFIFKSCPSSPTSSCASTSSSSLAEEVHTPRFDTHTPPPPTHSLAHRRFLDSCENNTALPPGQTDRPTNQPPTATQGNHSNHKWTSGQVDKQHIPQRTKHGPPCSMHTLVGFHLLLIFLTHSPPMHLHCNPC